jgi:hypothetical protein
MEQAAIVPDYALTRRPGVMVNKIFGRNERCDMFDQGASGVVVHALDCFGVITEKHCLSTGLRMNSHNRMANRRNLRLLR